MPRQLILNTTTDAKALNKQSVNYQVNVKCPLDDSHDPN